MAIKNLPKMISHAQTLLLLSSTLSVYAAPLTISISEEGLQPGAVDILGFVELPSDFASDNVSSTDPPTEKLTLSARRSLPTIPSLNNLARRSPIPTPGKSPIKATPKSPKSPKKLSRTNTGPSFKCLSPCADGSGSEEEPPRPAKEDSHRMGNLQSVKTMPGAYGKGGRTGANPRASLSTIYVITDEHTGDYGTSSAQKHTRAGDWFLKLEYNAGESSKTDALMGGKVPKEDHAAIDETGELGVWWKNSALNTRPTITQADSGILDSDYLREALMMAGLGGNEPAHVDKDKGKARMPLSPGGSSTGSNAAGAIGGVMSPGGSSAGSIFIGLGGGIMSPGGSSMGSAVGKQHGGDDILSRPGTPQQPQKHSENALGKQRTIMSPTGSISESMAGGEAGTPAGSPPGTPPGEARNGFHHMINGRMIWTHRDEEWARQVLVNVYLFLESVYTQYQYDQHLLHPGQIPTDPLDFKTFEEEVENLPEHDGRYDWILSQDPHNEHENPQPFPIFDKKTQAYSRQIEVWFRHIFNLNHAIALKEANRPEPKADYFLNMKYNIELYERLRDIVEHRLIPPIDLNNPGSNRGSRSSGSIMIGFDNPGSDRGSIGSIPIGYSPPSTAQSAQSVKTIPSVASAGIQGQPPTPEGVKPEELPWDKQPLTACQLEDILFMVNAFLSSRDGTVDLTEKEALAELRRKFSTDRFKSLDIFLKHTPTIFDLRDRVWTWQYAPQEDAVNFLFNEGSAIWNRIFWYPRPHVEREKERHDELTRRFLWLQRIFDPIVKVRFMFTNPNPAVELKKYSREQNQGGGRKTDADLLMERLMRINKRRIDRTRVDAVVSKAIGPVAQVKDEQQKKLEDLGAKIAAMKALTKNRFAELEKMLQEQEAGSSKQAGEGKASASAKAHPGGTSGSAEKPKSSGGSAGGKA